MRVRVKKPFEDQHEIRNYLQTRVSRSDELGEKWLKESDTYTTCKLVRAKSRVIQKSVVLDTDKKGNENNTSNGCFAQKDFGVEDGRSR